MHVASLIILSESSGMGPASRRWGHFGKMKLLLVVWVMLEVVDGLYSPYYRRCRINHGAIDADAVPIEALEVERFPNFSERHMSRPVISPEIDIQYTDYNYYLHSFLDSGGSGEVYLVEEVDSGEGKVLKRYFKERPKEFRRESYLMKQLNYSMGWTKYCKGVDKCSQEDKGFHSVAIFPYKQSIIFRNLEFDGQEAPLFFYKMLKEMDKIHRAGIIHNDIKMGNVMVNSIGLNFKFYEVQFIDWNLAMFYHTGLDTNMRHGTVCFYSPEQMLRTQYVNPSRDIWSLGVAMFTYYTDQKPFSYNCKKDNLKAIASLIGAEKLLALIKKYNYNTMQHMSFVKELEDNKEKYPQADLAKFKLTINQQHYTKDLVDVFKRMLQPDPEKRATAAELIKMKYFRNITTLPDIYYSRDKKKAAQSKTPKTTTKKQSQKSNQKQTV